MTNLDHFASELLLLILEHVEQKDLHACTLINRGFYKSTLPLLWRQVDIYSTQVLDMITTAMKLSPHTLGKCIRYATISAMVSDTALLAFIRHTPHLEHLYFKTSCNITDISFQHVPRFCPQLTELYLCSGGITMTSMRQLGEYCHQLRVLRLHHLHWLDYTDLVGLLHQWPLLQVLDLNLPSTGGYGSDTEDDDPLAQMAAVTLGSNNGFPDLTHVSLQNTSNNYSAFISTAVAYGFTWPHLTHLYLDGCHDVDHAMVTRFIQGHTGLESLAIIQSSLITDQTLDAIATYLPRIKKLTVDYCDELTMDGIFRLVNTCTSLVDGVGCAECDIYPDDEDVAFPSQQELDTHFDYKMQFDRAIRIELAWLARKKKVVGS